MRIPFFGEILIHGGYVRILTGWRQESRRGYRAAYGVDIEVFATRLPRIYMRRKTGQPVILIPALLLGNCPKGKSTVDWLIRPPKPTIWERFVVWRTFRKHGVK